MDDKYTVHSEFNIKKHNETFINYLEVIMYPSGKIEYAVPSHMEKLMAIAMKKYNQTRDQVDNECPEKYYSDYTYWLCRYTGCLAIYNFSYYGKANRIQQKMLEKLKAEGLYKGEISGKAMGYISF